MSLPILETDRLILRPWKPSDLVPFAEINSDPKVMESYESTLTRSQSDMLAEKIQYGSWAIEVQGKDSFIGYVGLNYWDLEVDFAPCFEIGWRLSSKHWGFGYATEAARKVLSYGFEVLKIPEIVSMATIQNMRSRRVMERLGMVYHPKENFYHPKLAIEHPLSLRVLYRLSYEEKTNSI